MYTNCARFLQIYDTDLILSWTPAEYQAFIKGSQLHEIDELERLAIGAILQAKANTEKRTNLKKLFDADKARRKIEQGTDKNEEIERSMKLNEAFKGFKPQFIPKGGH